MSRAEKLRGEATSLGGRTPPDSLPALRAHQEPAPADKAPPASAGGARGAPVASRAGLGFRTVVRNRYFLRLWLAQLISQTIMNAANYGIIILIATQSKSVTATGGAIAAFSLPAALFGAPAGVFVDRFDKRFVLWMSNALRALASLGFVVTLFLDKSALVPVYFLIFFIAVVGQFFAPAEGAAIPMLVHRDELVNALALFNITFTLSQAAGLILLGPLIIATLPTYSLGMLFGHSMAISPVESLFLIVGALYLICAVLVATIPHDRLANRDAKGQRGRVAPAESERVLDIWGGVAECWTFVRRDRTLFAAVLQLAMAGTVLAVIAEIAPRFVKEFFNLPEVDAALVFVPAGAGLVIGSVVLPHVIKRVNHSGRLVGLGLVLLAGSTFVLTLLHAVASYVHQNTGASFTPYIITTLALTFFMGFGLDLITIPAQTTMQQGTPDRLRGRVLALQNMLFSAATVPAVFLIGLLADYFHLPPAMNVMAAVVLVGGFVTIAYGRTSHQSAQRHLDAASSRQSGPTEQRALTERARPQAISGPIALERGGPPDPQRPYGAYPSRSAKRTD